MTACEHQEGSCSQCYHGVDPVDFSTRVVCGCCYPRKIIRIDVSGLSPKQTIEKLAATRAAKWNSTALVRQVDVPRRGLVMRMLMWLTYRGDDYE